MGKPATGEELLQLLELSQLVHKNLIESLRGQLKTLGPDAQDPQKLALILVKNHVCTAYQVRQLLEGRFKGFYIGKYKFLELLGAGGMGKVYLAEQITMQRLVAIKVVRQNIPKSMQKEVLARFTREARAVAGLQHQNIIRAYDFDQENGVPYFVMEYVEGIDAANQVIKFGPIGYRQAADYIAQTANALHHAHKNGMVHRDIKPGNILVSTDGEIKLLDLGLVACFDGTQNNSITVAENQLGTVDYIAPEQALDSHKVDPRADIYSLGATLYTILCGKVLFPGKSTAQKLLLNQTEYPTPIQQLVPGIPDEFAAIINKMIQKKPEDRFQTAEEVATAVERFTEKIVPPYDPSAVKYRSSDIDQFLGRSPDASQINFNQINSDTPTTTAETSQINSPSEPPQKSNSGPLPGASPATTKADEEFMKAMNEMADLQLPSIPRRRVSSPSGIGRSSGLSSRSKNRKKPVRKNSGDQQRNMVTMIAAISTLSLAVVFIAFYALSTLSANATRARKLEQQLASQTTTDNKSASASNSNPQQTKPQNNNQNKPAPKKKKPQGNQPNSPQDSQPPAGQTPPAQVAATPTPDRTPTPDAVPPTSTTPDNAPSVPNLASNDPVTTSPGNEVDGSNNSQMAASTSQNPDETTPPATTPAPTEMASVPTPPKKPNKKNANKPNSPTPDKPEAPRILTPAERWAAYNQQLHEDASLVWHSSFLKTKDKKEVLKNEAKLAPQPNASLVINRVDSAEGRFDNKLSLRYTNRGVEEYALIPYEAIEKVDFEKGLTAAIWYKADPSNNGSFALLNRGRNFWRIHRINRKDVLQFGIGNPSTSESSEVITHSEFSKGEWHLAVGTIRPLDDAKSEFTLYLDGNKENTASGSTPRSSATTGILVGMAQEASNNLSFQGLIDEFAIFNRPLSEIEVMQMYNAGNLLETPAESTDSTIPAATPVSQNDSSSTLAIE